MRLFAAAAFLVWAAAGPACGETMNRIAALPPSDEPQSGDTADALDAELDRAGRMTAPVFLNGAGPFAFTLDTGADCTVVSDHLASTLGLPPGTTATLHDITGSSRVRTAKVARLRVGSREIGDISAAVLSRTDLGAMGMLGIDSLSDQRVVLDFKARRIEISASPKRAERVEPDTIVVRAKRRFGQLVLVDSRFRGRKVYVIIDTGAQVSIGNSALRRLVTRRRTLFPVEVIAVTGNRATADQVTLPEIELGGVRVTNLPIAFAELHTFQRYGLEKEPAMLLGMDVLRRFERVSVDFVQKRARFQLARSDPPRSIATNVPTARTP